MSLSNYRSILLAWAGIAAVSMPVLAQDAQGVPQAVRITSDGNTIQVQMIDGSDLLTSPNQTVSIGGQPKAAGGGGAMTITSSDIIPKADIAQMRKNQMDSLREAMGCNDAEWAIIEPKLEKIQALASNAAEPIALGGPLIKFASPTASTGAASPVRITMQSLTQLLQNGAASEAEIRQKIAAYREAKAAALAELKRARQDLAEILTQRQEAILITHRILE